MKVLINILLLMLIPLPSLSKPITVFIIDSGVSLNHQFIASHVDYKNFNPDNYLDSLGHGTHVAGTIVNGTCKEVTIVSCRYYYDKASQGENTKRYLNCLEEAVLTQPDIINISSGGKDNIVEEFYYFAELSVLNIPVVVSMGNDGENLQYFDYYPAKYGFKNIIPVGNLNKNRERHITSNYGLPNEVWEFGTYLYGPLNNGKWGYLTGTSMAAAVHTNRMLKEMCAKIH